MRKAIGGYALILAAVLLLSFAFFSLDHDAMPEWAVTAISIAFAVFTGVFVYFIIRRFKG
ncbi:MAG: hypothetical protein ACO1OO_02705 [Flavisolibacter sp.]